MGKGDIRTLGNEELANGDWKKYKLFVLNSVEENKKTNNKTYDAVVNLKVAVAVLQVRIAAVVVVSNSLTLLAVWALNR